MKSIIKAIIAFFTPVPETRQEMSAHCLPIWHHEDANTVYAFPDLYCHQHDWFYFKSELNITGHNCDTSHYEDRICQRCFVWECRLQGVTDFMNQGHGKQAFKKLLKMKIEEITTGNPVDHLT